ncbi:MAG TPA: flagellar hook capping FlgD N-terminal domain-containing protein [Nitrospiraceae bacterium]|nr:flagellar hook capping FlgD N-terminal domain-containing protein [Nitrospiraceae bacterium]
MSTISDVLAASGTGGTTGTTTDTPTASQSGQLGNSDFLKLLVTQLQNQDPLNPTDNDSFIMESAAFSQVQELTQLVSLVQQLVDKPSTVPSPPSDGTTGADGTTDKTNA